MQPPASPLTFARTDNQYRFAKEQGFIPQDTDMRDFARIMSEVTGNQEYLGIADDSWIANKLKRGSAALDRGLEWTGAPQATADLGRFIAQQVGVDNPDQVADITRGLPRAAVDMAGMMIPYFGMAGKIATAGMAGTNAYEKSDSIQQAIVGGATPFVASKLFGFAGRKTLDAIKKVPGLSKVGLKGGETVTKPVTDKFGNVTEVTGRMPVTVADRAAYYVGGQAGATIPFLAKDVYEQGEQALTPENLLGMAINQLAFAPFDVPSLIKPQFIGKTTNTTPEPAPEYTATQLRKKEFVDAINAADKAQHPILRSQWGVEAAGKKLFDAKVEELRQAAAGERLKARHEMESSLEALHKEGVWDGVTPLETMLKAPDKYPSGLTTLLESYKKSMTEIAKREHQVIRPFDTEMLFDVALKDLGLTADNEFVTTSVQARTAELYQKTFGGKLTEQQIGDLYRQDKLMFGPEPDMSMFTGWVKKEKPSKAEKKKSAKANAAKIAAGEPNPALTPEQQQAAAEQKVKTYLDTEVNAGDGGIKKLFRATLDDMVQKHGALDGPAAALKRFRTLHPKLEDWQVALIAGEALADSNVWEIVNGDIVPTTVEPVTETIKNAAAVVDNKPNTKSIAEITTGLLGRGMTLDEAATKLANSSKVAEITGDGEVLGAEPFNSLGEAFRQAAIAEMRKLSEAGETPETSARFKELNDQLMKDDALKRAKRDAAPAEKGKPVVGEAQPVDTAKLNSLLGALDTLSGRNPTAKPAASESLSDNVVTEIYQLLAPEFNRQTKLKLLDLFEQHGNIQIDGNFAEILRQEVILDTLRQQYPDAQLHRNSPIVQDLIGRLNFKLFTTGQMQQFATKYRSAEGLSKGHLGRPTKTGASPRDIARLNWYDDILNLRSVSAIGDASGRRLRDANGRLKLDDAQTDQVLDQVYAGAGLTRQQKRKMSQQDFLERRDTLLARLAVRKATPEEILELFPLKKEADKMGGRDDVSREVLAKMLSEQMSEFELADQHNAMIDAVRQIDAIFKPNEDGVAEIDNMIAQAKKDQGVVYADKMDMQQKIVNTLFNWMHNPLHWFNKEIALTQQDIIVQNRDGSKSPFEAIFRQSLDNRIKREFGKDVPANKAVDSKRLQKIVDELLTAPELQQALGDIVITLPASKLKTAQERIVHFNGMLKTAVKNAVRQQWSTVSVKQSGTKNNKRFLARVHTVEQVKQPDPYFDESLATTPEAAKRITDVETEAPDSILRELENQKRQNPGEYFRIAEQPAKGTLTKKALVEVIKQQEGLTDGEIAQYVANPETWPGVELVGPNKYSFREWIIKRHTNVDDTFVPLEVLVGKEVVQDSTAELGKQGVSDQVLVETADMLETGLVPDAVGGEGEPSTGRFEVADKEFNKALEIARGLREEYGDSEIGVLQELFESYQEISGAERREILEAFAQADPRMVEALFGVRYAMGKNGREVNSDGSYKMEVYNSPLKMKPETRINLFRSYDTYRNLMERQAYADVTLAADGKILQVGQSVGDMLASYGVDARTAAVIMQGADVRLKAILFDITEAHSTGGFGSSMRTAREVLDLRNTSKPNTTKAVQAQKKGKNGRVFRLARGYAEAEADIKRFFDDLKKLTEGTRRKPVMFDGEMFVLEGEVQSIFEGYLTDAKVDALTKGRFGTNEPVKKLLRVSQEELNKLFTERVEEGVLGDFFTQEQLDQIRIRRELVSKIPDKLMPIFERVEVALQEFTTKAKQTKHFDRVKELKDLLKEHQAFTREIKNLALNAEAVNEAQFTEAYNKLSLKKKAWEERIGRIFDVTELRLASTTPLKAALRHDPSIHDLVVPPEVLAQKIFDQLGLPREYREQYMRDFARVVELAQVKGVNYNRLVDDAQLGIFGSADTLTRTVYVSAGESFKSLAKGDKARGTLYFTAHELTHILEADARAGRYGEEAQTIFNRLDGFIGELTPTDRTALMDVFYETGLPKEFRTQEVRDVIGNLNPSELIANLSAMHNMSLLGKRDNMFMNLMPGPVRRAFDWIAGHLSDMFRAARMFAVGRGTIKNYKDARKIVSMLDKVRLQARKAEQDFTEVARFANYTPEGMREIRSSLFDYVDASFGKSAEVKDWMQLAGRYGNIGDPVGSTKQLASEMFEKMEDLNLRNPSTAPIGRLLRDSNTAMNTEVTKIVAPLFGTTDALSGNLLVDHNKPVFKIASSPASMKAYTVLEQEARVAGKPLLENTAQPGENPKFKFLAENLTPKARGHLNALTREARQMVLEVYQQRYMSQQLSNESVVRVRGEAAANRLSQMISRLPAFANRFDQARELGAGLFKAVQTGDRSVVDTFVMDFNDADFKAVVDHAQKEIDLLETLTKNFAKDATYLSFRRFEPVFVRFRKFDNETGEMRHLAEGFKTSDEATEYAKAAKAEGWEEVGVHTKANRSQVRIDAESPLFQSLKAKEDTVRKSIELLPIDADIKSQLQAELDFTSQIQKEAASFDEGFGTKPKFTAGFDKQNPLLQHYQYVARVQRLAHREVLQTGFEMLMEHPELREQPHVKQQLRQAYQNYITPDSAIGKMIGKANAVYFLGFNLPSHMVEFMQPLMTLMPEWIAQGGGYVNGVKKLATYQKRLAGAYLELGKMSAKEKTNPTEALKKIFKDPDEYNTIVEAINRGRIGFGQLSGVYDVNDVLGEQQVKLERAMSGADVSKVDIVKHPIHWYARTSMQFYSMFTRHNELTGLLMGREAAKLKGLNGQAAIEYAMDFSTSVNKSGGRAGRQTAPFTGNKMIGHVLYSLAGYTTGWMGQLARYYSHGWGEGHSKITPQNRADARKAFKTMFLSQLGFAGVLGMPFFGAALRLLENFTGEDLEAQMTEAMSKVTDDPMLLNMATTGMANTLLEAAGAPVDIHSRLAIGGLMGMNAYEGFSPMGLLGPTASQVEGYLNMGKSIVVEQDLLGGLKTGGPPWIRKLADMIGSDFQVPGKPDNTFTEGLAYGLGFQNADVAKMRRQKSLELSMQKSHEVKMNRAALAVIKAAELGPQAAQTAAKKHALEMLPENLTAFESHEMLESLTQKILKKAAESETKKRFPARVGQGTSEPVKIRARQMAETLGIPSNFGTKTEELNYLDNALMRFGVQPPSRDWQAAQMADQQYSY